MIQFKEHKYWFITKIQASDEKIFHISYRNKNSHAFAISIAKTIEDTSNWNQFSLKSIVDLSIYKFSKECEKENELFEIEIKWSFLIWYFEYNAEYFIYIESWYKKDSPDSMVSRIQGGFYENMYVTPEEVILYN